MVSQRGMPRDYIRERKESGMKQWMLAIILCGVATWASAASTIQGTVTQYAGTPLSSINVEAYKFNGSWWEQMDTAFTDGSGQYQLSGLDAGNYRVYFQDWNGDYISEWYDNVLEEQSATTIVVGTSVTISNINARLAPASKITGMVTNSSGDGISLYVQAYRYNGRWWEQWAYDYSQESGAYSIGGLPNGTYRIKFTQWEGDYATEWYNNTPFENNAESILVPPLSIVSNINAMVGPAAKITGTITGPSGTPLLENINVAAYLWDGSEWVQVNSTSTDSNGVYIVGGLPPGQCLVQFRDWQNIYAPEWFSNVLNQAQANQIAAIAGTTRSNINAALSAAASISGTVTAPNGITPIPDISVTAYRWTGTFWDYAQGDQTDGAGQYDITGLATGRYQI